MSKMEFRLLKISSQKTARELQYPKETIDAIKAAKTENEIYRILATARERWL